MCYSTLQQNNLFEITQDSPTFLRHTHSNATVVCEKFEPTGVERPRREPKLLPLILSESLGIDLSLSIVHLFLQVMNGKERRREIQADKQSKRVGVCKRHMVSMTADLSTVPI